jgi:hypothetical protein
LIKGRTCSHCKPSSLAAKLRDRIVFRWADSPR